MVFDVSKENVYYFETAVTQHHVRDYAAVKTWETAKKTGVCSVGNGSCSRCKMAVVEKTCAQ